MTDKELQRNELVVGQELKLVYRSGVTVEGRLKKITKCGHRPVILSFTHCRVRWLIENLFLPEWGTYDLGVGLSVPSIFGGAADRKAYGITDTFVAKKLPKKKYSTAEKKLFKLYDQINKWVDNGKYSRSDLEKLLVKAEEFPDAWLLRFEILQLSLRKRWKTDWQTSVRNGVLTTVKKYPDVAPYVRL